MDEKINEISSNSADNPILDIVNSIQNKLNENNYTNNDIANSNKTDKKDLSGLNISKILEGFNNVNTNNIVNNSNKSNNSGLNLDMNTIMNFQKILGRYKSS